MGGMGCDWLVASGQSKLLRPALYLAVNALSLSLSFHLSLILVFSTSSSLLPQQSAHLGRERTGKEAAAWQNGK